MREELPLPAELQHLLEKRDGTERRKAAPAKPTPQPTAGERRKAARRKPKRGSR
jgi:hypothetical protein